MDITLKEALGFIIAVICVGVVAFALYNFGGFTGIGNLFEGVM